MMVLLTVAVSILSFLIVPSTVGSELYPARSVRLLTTMPGSGSDFLARTIAPKLSNSLGESVIVDNRASRLLGRQGAQAASDGYTLILAGSNFQYVPLVQEQGYDPIKSFTGISQVARSPYVLVVNSALPVNSVKELIALAHSKPGHLNYGSSGLAVPSISLLKC